MFRIIADDLSQQRLYRVGKLADILHRQYLLHAEMHRKGALYLAYQSDMHDGIPAVDIGGGGTV